MNCAIAVVFLVACVSPSVSLSCYHCNSDLQKRVRCDMEISTVGSTQYPDPAENTPCPDTVTLCQTTVTKVTTITTVGNQTQTNSMPPSYDRSCDRAGDCLGVRSNCTKDGNTKTCVDIICCSGDLCNASLGGSGAGFVFANSFLVAMVTVFAMLLGL
jgi:hypothetical protein